MKIPFILFSLLTPVALLPGHAAPVKAPVTTPQKGEIALEGRIVSLDVVKNIIVMRVAAMSRAGGKSSRLPVAQNKLIVASLTTTFSNSSGKFVSLGDLDKDEEIVVVGREGAGQFLARLIVWQAREIVEKDPNTPLIVAPLLPNPQKAFGASLRPNDALWSPKNTADHPYKNSMPAFLTRWRLRAETPSGDDEWGNPLQRFSVSRLVRISGPKGEALELIRPGTPNYVQFGDGEMLLANDDVDPRWSFLNFEWELHDPQAGSASLGRFTSELKWDNLDFPKKDGEKLEIGRDLTSAQGTTIRLVRIARSERGLSFDFRIVKGAKAPDAQVRLALLSLSDQKDNQIPSSGSTSYGGDTYNLSTRSAPPDDAGKVELKVRLFETVASLQDRSKYKSLKFQIPVQSVWKARPMEIQAKAPIVAENAQLKVQMEGARLQSSNFSATLWVENKENPLPKTNDWRYLLRSGAVLDAAGKSTNLYIPVGDEKKRIVRENGEIAAPNLFNQEIQAYISTAQRSAGPLDLSLTFERARSVRHATTFRDVALPVTEENRKLKADQIADDYFEVLRVVRYSNGQVFAGLPDASKTNLKSGVAIVVEFSPLFVQAGIQFEVLRIVDSKGRVWDTRELNSVAGDATIAGDRSGRIRTVFLPNLDTTIKQITLDLSASELQWEGSDKQILKFRVP